MGNVSIEIDFSISNIWRSWFKFRHGKRKIKELENFQYFLEDNLWRLYLDLNEKSYTHGPYRHFTIQENKRRDIAVASVRDRVIHRLVYEYLVKIYDRSFIYDAWSCRKDKGLVGAIDRTEKFFKKYPRSFVWRADVTKFFDNIKHNVLADVLFRRVKDVKAMWLIKIILESYVSRPTNERERERERNNPSGNTDRQSYQPDFCEYLFQ